MIVAKGMKGVSGYIEYRYDYDRRNPKNAEITEDDRDCMFESLTFDSLKDLLDKMKPEVLEEVRESYDADRAWISCISFRSKSEDGKTTADISLYEDKERGHVSTEITNEDITDRAMLNMKRIKDIAENTLSKYPVKY